MFINKQRNERERERRAGGEGREVLERKGKKVTCARSLET